MIIKASDDLRRIVFKLEDKTTPLPGKISPQNLDYLLPIMPEWLKALLVDGNVLIFSKEGYYELSPEITTHMEVLSH